MRSRYLLQLFARGQVLTNTKLSGEGPAEYGNGAKGAGLSVEMTNEGEARVISHRDLGRRIVHVDGVASKEIWPYSVNDECHAADGRAHFGRAHCVSVNGRMQVHDGAGFEYPASIMYASCAHLPKPPVRVRDDRIPGMAPKPCQRRDQSQTSDRKGCLSNKERRKYPGQDPLVSFGTPPVDAGRRLHGRLCVDASGSRVISQNRRASGSRASVVRTVTGVYIALPSEVPRIGPSDASAQPAG